ncbi:MAG: hypothetical protein E7431_02765 [Ruminococcaceae bacterium]|nr:hypothetical protein [Oscillospiraceae bacterium]
MKFKRIFGIGAKKILSKNCSVKGVVTGVGNSYIHVVKKPVRLYVNDSNTMYSHYIFFTYTVDNIPYKGKLYVDLNYRCPQKGETVEVFYDPENPADYAFYSFGPNPNPLGW